jgi:glycosyltransferase involved in cell wall biosynthesis
MIRDLCRHADHIVTVSEFSRQDIIRFTGIEEQRITNTYQAVQLPAHLLAREESEVVRDLEALFGLDYRGYFLFVGALEPKKNLSRLIDAYSASGVDGPLIVAGGLGWMYESDLEKIGSEQFLTYELDGNRIRPRRRVRRLAYLPLDHLVLLLRGAKALLFPSLYEGFGLPVLEAMTVGTPVMTSNVSSLPEIAGDAALLIDPYDVDAMAEAIRRLDADHDLCRELTARGSARAREFSPERYAARLDLLYEQLLR